MDEIGASRLGRLKLSQNPRRTGWRHRPGMRGAEGAGRGGRGQAGPRYGPGPSGVGAAKVGVKLLLPCEVDDELVSLAWRKMVHTDPELMPGVVDLDG